MVAQRFTPQGSGSGTAAKSSVETSGDSPDSNNAPEQKPRGVDEISRDVANLQSNYTGTAEQQRQKVTLKREIDVEIETTVNKIERITEAGGNPSQAQARLSALQRQQRNLNALDSKDSPSEKENA